MGAQHPAREVQQHSRRMSAASILSCYPSTCPLHVEDCPQLRWSAEHWQRSLCIEARKIFVLTAIICNPITPSEYLHARRLPFPTSSFLSHLFGPQSMRSRPEISLSLLRFRMDPTTAFAPPAVPLCASHHPSPATTCSIHQGKTTFPATRTPVRARVERRARPSCEPHTHQSPDVPTQFSRQLTTPQTGTREALELLYESAKGEEKSGRLRNALRMYESLVQLDRSNGRAWVRYATALQREGDVQRVRDVLRRALRFNPRNAILWQTWADVEKSFGNIETARRLFRKALEANSQLPSLYHSWGSMEYKQGRIEEARRLYQRGLRKCPNATRLYHSLGVLEDKRGNSKSARVILTDGLKLEPDNPHLHHALGVLEYRAGRVASARECFTRATRVDPRHTLSWLSFAQLEEFEGNADMARKYYIKGTSVESRSAVQLWQAWARMEEKAGNIPIALQIYERAVSFYPKDGMLYCSWGKLVESKGEIERARSIFREGLAAEPTKSYLWQALALLEQRQLNLRIARELFARGMEASSGKEAATLVHAWAALEWEDGDEAKARELFRKATTLDGSCSWLWLWFGRFEVAHENFSIARHYFSRSINLDHRDSSPWRAWAELERAAGDEQRARFMFRRAAELESSRDLFEMDPERPLRRPWRKL